MPIIRCEVCNYFYMSDLLADRRVHSRRHDEHVNGIPWKAMDKESLLEEKPGLRLVPWDSRNAATKGRTSPGPPPICSDLGGSGAKRLANTLGARGGLARTSNPTAPNTALNARASAPAAAVDSAGSV